MAKNQYTQRKPLYFRIWELPIHQKLGMILEKKVVQNLKLEKKPIQKLYPKLIFLHEKKIKKIPLIFDIEN